MMPRGGGGVESVMHAGGCHYGGGMDSIKVFYANHRTPTLVVGGVLAAAVIGLAGYGIYKKWIWKNPAENEASE
jgi:hypothetical protein